MNVHEPTAEVIELEAVEVIEITELSPYDNTFIGKRIERDGSITPYPKSVMWWRQPWRAARPPSWRCSTICARRARATSSDPRRAGQPVAGEDTAAKRRREGARRSRLPRRADQAVLLRHRRRQIDWRADPEGAVRRIVAQLGEPFSSASFRLVLLSQPRARNGDRRGRRRKAQTLDRADRRRRCARAADIPHRPRAGLARGGRADPDREGARRLHGRRDDLAAGAAELHPAPATGTSTPVATHSAIFRPSAGSGAHAKSSLFPPISRTRRAGRRRRGTAPTSPIILTR